ncbi:MAG: hypothetical protein EA361_14215 [Bacteroidetes bacterium]|nr:MAG: hypothetical protein EA361_14215 [Bacteroidota bacterium]
MNPFSKYIDCINCGNELTHVSELTFRMPREIVCDYCGQQYNGLQKKINRIKMLVSAVFIFMALVVSWLAFSRAGVSTALFALFPVFIVYLFVLGYAVRKSVRF